MRTGLALSVLGGVALTAGGAMFAAAGEARQGQDRPGQISRAKVWIENRGRSETVPVAIEEVMTATPIGVQVIGTPTVAIAPASVVQARLVRQAWDYRVLNMTPGQDAASVLSAAGGDGWEVVTTQLSGASGSVVVLKRPR